MPIIAYLYLSEITLSLFRFVCMVLARGRKFASNAKQFERKHINFDSYGPLSAFQKAPNLILGSIIRSLGKQKKIIGKSWDELLELILLLLGDLYCKLLEIICLKARGNYSGPVWSNSFSIVLLESPQTSILMISGFLGLVGSLISGFNVPKYLIPRICNRIIH